MGKTIGAKIVLEGESEFRQAITASNKSLSTMKSELALVTTQYSKNANSLEALKEKQEVYIKLQEEQKKKLSLLKDQQEKAIQTQEKEKNVLDDLKKKQNETADRLEKTKKIYGENSNEVKKLNTELEDVDKEYKTQEKALVSIQNKIENYSKDINIASKELIELNEAGAENKKYLNEAETGFSNCASSIDKFGNVTKKATDNFNYMKAALLTEALSIAEKGIMTLGRGMVTVSKATINIGKDFETSMSTVAATMSISSDEIRNCTGNYKILEDAAKNAGQTTKYSATEAGDALNYLALAGYDAASASAALPDVLNLASAGAMDLAFASDLVTDSMSALGISTNELTGFTDQMAVTSQKSNTNISQLGEAILTIGGTAKQLAGGTVELNTELGILADNGIKGAEGGTALRNVLKNLTAPTDEASTALKKYNINVYDTAGNIRPLNETFQDLQKSLNGLSDQKRNNVLNKIFDSENLKSAEALIANCGDRFDELSEYIKNCDGAAANMADTMSDNLDGKTKQLGNTLQNLGVSIYSKFEEPMKSAVNTATGGVNELQDSLNGGRLGESVDGLASSFEELSGTLVELGVDALPTMIDAVSWVLDNSGAIITVITGTTLAVTGYKGATVAATVAQNVFNVTANLNPYVKMASLILGAAGAITTYISVTKLATSASGETANTIKNNNKKIQETVESIDSLNTDLNTNASYVRTLKTELIDLQSKQSDDEISKRRVAEIVRTLNQNLPELNLSINAQTGYLDDNTDSLNKNIESQIAYQQYQAMQDKMGEIYKETADGAYELWKAEKELERIGTEISTVQKEKASLAEKWNQQVKDGIDITWDYQAELNSLENQEAALTEKQNELTDSSTKYKASIDEANGKITEMNSFCDEQVSAMDESTKAALGLTDAQSQLGKTTDGTGKIIEETADSVTEAYTEMRDSLKKSVEDQLSLFEEFSGGTEISKQQILSNMESQIQGISNWATNIESLAARTDVAVNQQFLQYLANLGPSSANYIAAFAEMSGPELQKAMDDFATAMELPNDVTKRIMNSYQKAGADSSAAMKTGLEASEEGIRMQTENIAENIEKGYQTGLKKSQEGIEKQTRELVEKGIIDSAKKKLEINSPSKVTTRFGEYTGVGLATGIKNKTQTVTQQMIITSKAVLTSAQSNLKKDKFETIGLIITSGLASGISKGKSDVVKAMQAVAQAVIDSANQTMSSVAIVKNTSGSNVVNGWNSSAKQISENAVETRSIVMNNPIEEIYQKTDVGSLKIGNMEEFGTIIKNAVKSGIQNMNISINPEFKKNEFIEWTLTVNNERKIRTGEGLYV